MKLNFNTAVNSQIDIPSGQGVVKTDLILKALN
jgi:hypothetical protein